MRLRAGLLTLALCGGCFFEVKAGAYRTQQPTQSGQAYELGLAIGWYLDSYRTPVAVSYSGTHDSSQASTGVVSRYSSHDQQVRVDYTLGQRLARFQPTLVGAIGWGDDSTLVFADGSEEMRSLSSQYTVFGGIGYRRVLSPGYAWNDAITVAIGPAVQRFDTVLGGEFSNTGAQVRLSAQISPINVIVGVAYLLGGGGGPIWENYHPTPITAAPSQPDYKPNICSPTHRDINCK
jgi:hypothetical protein